MPTKDRVQYTLRGVPREVDELLRRKARRRGISLNQLLIEQICLAGDGVPGRRYRRLKDLGGRWQNDPEFDRILAEQRRVDRELWK